MQYHLSYQHAHAVVVLQRLLEWATTILLMIAAYPVFKQLLMYVLMRLYEIFIQHQYLF